MRQASRSQWSVSKCFKFRPICTAQIGQKALPPLSPTALRSKERSTKVLFFLNTPVTAHAQWLKTCPFFKCSKPVGSMEIPKGLPGLLWLQVRCCCSSAAGTVTGWWPNSRVVGGRRRVMATTRMICWCGKPVNPISENLHWWSLSVLIWSRVY